MAQSWLTGVGEAGALMRARDWSHSPLGPPAGWPPSLRSAVGLMLGSKFPMFLAWGPELALLYNDAYAEILADKHPDALGAPMRAAWGEIWDDISPLIAAALRGEATFREDLPLTMNRHGYDEQTAFTFSYSPLRDETGAVAGMFCAVVETTERVRVERRQAFLFELDDRLNDLEDPGPMLEAAAGMLGQLLGADRVHWAMIDDAAGTFEVRQEWTAPGAPSLLGAHRLADFGEALIAEMRAGRTVAVEDVLADGRADAGGVEHIGPGIRGALSIPLFRGEAWEAALCVHTLAPRRWHDHERELIREVAARAWTRAERARSEALVRESEARFRALVNATSDVVFRVNADWTEMRRLEGRGFLADTDSPSVAWLDAYIFPEDQPALLAEVRRAIARGAVFELEHRVRRADGSVGWTQSRAIPLRNARGEIVEWFGAASDITVRKAAEDHLRLMVNELNHRVKNSLATVQAITTQTLRRGEIPAEVREALTARLVALAEAHDVLTDARWAGADLAEIARQAAAPYVSLSGSSPFRIDGPDVLLPPKTAIALALAFHELATNAAKYGALSTPAGQVAIRWTVSRARGARRLRLTWRERGGPPVRPPKGAGFGTRLIQRALAAELQGDVTLDYAPEGLVCTMDAVLPDDPAEAWKIDLQLA